MQNLSFAPIFAVCSVIYLLALGLAHWLVGELGPVNCRDELPYRGAPAELSKRAALMIRAAATAAH